MKKAVIFGGSGGIGFATAQMLRQRGYSLHLTGRDEERLSDRAASIDATFTAGDVTDDRFFERVSADAGNVLSGLVYAVGTIDLRSLARLTEADLLRDFRINALGAALAVRAFLPALKKSDGISSVVLFSSIAARQGFPMHASVGMAKGAVEGLTLSLAAELSPKVRVNAIAPSLTRTPLAASMTGNEQLANAISALHPMQRLGEPDDIASLAAFLLSEESNWITGQVFGVDGGRSTLRVKG